MPPTAEIRVRVTPRASRDEVVGWRDEVLLVRLTAPPVEGAANRACQRLLARVLAVAPGRVALVAGEKAREKRFAVSGLTPAEARAKIEGHLAGTESKGSNGAVREG
jgi:uncharacterized protein (TIGR00251 family)